MQNYTITCLFLHAHYTETLKGVEKFVKKVYGEKHSFIELTYDVGTHWNCINKAILMCTNNIMVLKLRKPILYLYTNQISCSLLFLF